LPLASATIMVYSTGHDQSAHRQISDRADCPPPGVFIPGRDFRYRSGIQQYRGMVVVDSRGASASQGPAVLSLARGKFGTRIRPLVFQKNLLPDDSGEPIRHSQVAEIFVKDK